MFLSQSSRHGRLAQRLRSLYAPREDCPLILDEKPQWISIEFQAEKVEKQLECYLAANAVAPRPLTQRTVAIKRMIM